MTLKQMSRLKRWQVAHRQLSPLEYHTWDAVLTLWIMGWMGLPAALLLWQPGEVLLCVVVFFVPALYMRLRTRLHRRGRLRCDWLDVVAVPPTPARMTKPD